MPKNPAQGLLWLAVGIAATVLSTKYDMGSLSDPGPGALPFGLGLVFIGLSLALMFGGRQREGEAEAHAPFGPLWRKVVYTSLLLAAVTLALESLGYLLAMFILITVSMLIITPRRWVSALLLGAFSSFFTYVLFDIWLRVPLPGGLFSFGG